MFQLKLAIRSLLKTPLVTAVAVLSLALGMGANAAIFSVFEQFVLRPLPAREPGRLVNLLSPGPKQGSQSTNNAGDIDSVFSYAMFRDLEKGQESFTGIAAHRSFGANLSYQGNTVSGEGMMVSGSYFEVLGLRPALGRLLGPDDDRSPGAHSLVVLSYNYWKTRFDLDSGILNQALVVNGQPMTVVGVAPEGFKGTTLGQTPKIFVPLSMRAAMTPGWDAFEDRRNYWVYLFARLRPGVSLEPAQTAANALYQPIIQDVELPLQQGLSDRTQAAFRGKQLVLEPGSHGQSSLQGQVRGPLLLLIGVTVFVLLIACANIANLLFSKAANRSGEIAVQLSLGANRRHLVGQLLAESFFLAAAGGLASLLVARLTVRGIASALPGGGGGLGFELAGETWLFLLILVLLTGLVGLAPALQSTRQSLVTALKNQPGQAASRFASRFRTGLAVFQIALSMTLLISAGLFTKSLLKAARVDLGIAVESLATFGLSPELNNYEPSRSHALFERLEDEIAALPGVARVAASRVPLISGSNWGSNVSVQGFEAGPDTDTHANFNQVGPGYFRTLGIPLLAGREFERTDTIGTPDVAIVNETFAKKFGLGSDPVGKRMQVGSGGEMNIEIVGFVKDSKYSEVKERVPPLFFQPYRQDDGLGAINFYVRTEGDPGNVLNSLRATVARLDPNLPVEELQTMALQVRENLTLERVLSMLSASFAVLATLLAAIGLYGVLAYAVAQRRREIGMRMALGADAGRIRRLIMGQVGWMTLPGALLGAGAALLLGWAARSLLFEIKGHDPGVFAVAILSLAAVAFLAGLFPALRAARVHPMEALRDD